jgi:hypothetical protein
MWKRSYSTEEELPHTRALTAGPKVTRSKDTDNRHKRDKEMKKKKASGIPVYHDPYPPEKKSPFCQISQA